MHGIMGWGCATMLEVGILQEEHVAAALLRLPVVT